MCKNSTENASLFAHPAFDEMRSGFAVWLHERFGAVESTMRRKMMVRQAYPWELAGIASCVKRYDEEVKPYGKPFKGKPLEYMKHLPNPTRFVNWMWDNYHMANHTVINRMKKHTTPCKEWEERGLNALFEEFLTIQKRECEEQMKQI